MFEWYVVRCGSKNWHQNNTRLKKIVFSANLSRLNSQHDWDTVYTLIVDKMFLQALKIMRQMMMGMIWIC